jgi:hypothetical protein
MLPSTAVMHKKGKMRIVSLPNEDFGRIDKKKMQSGFRRKHFSRA